MNEKYILDYKIYNGEKTDIDLSSWRSQWSPNENWKKNFKKCYNIDWGKHEWLHSSRDDKWKDTIIINIVSKRLLHDDKINKLKTFIECDTKSSFCFISFDDERYTYFTNNTGINMPLHKPNTLEELSIILNSCKYAYLGLSAIQTMCAALHKKHSVCVNYKIGYTLTTLKNDIHDDWKDIFEMDFDEI
jgi:hypothetical protein